MASRRIKGEAFYTRGAACTSGRASRQPLRRTTGAPIRCPCRSLSSTTAPAGSALARRPGWRGATVTAPSTSRPSGRPREHPTGRRHSPRVTRSDRTPWWSSSGPAVRKSSGCERTRWRLRSVHWDYPGLSLPWPFEPPLADSPRPPTVRWPGDAAASRSSGRRLRLPRHRYTPREEIHVRVAVGLARGELVVEFACQPAIVDGRRAALAARDDVVDLEPQGRTADASGIERPRALALVAGPHLSPHRGGMWPDVVGRETFRGALTAPGLIACCASRRSSAASMTFSAEAPGCACP